MLLGKETETIIICLFSFDYLQKALFYFQYRLLEYQVGMNSLKMIIH